MIVGFAGAEWEAAGVPLLALFGVVKVYLLDFIGEYYIMPNVTPYGHFLAHLRKDEGRLNEIGIVYPEFAG